MVLEDPELLLLKNIIIINMESVPNLLHIELGNQSIPNWIEKNKYIIFSEIIRYSEIMVDESLEFVQAIMVSNLADNIVFVLKKDYITVTLQKAMEYFIEREEFEKCAEIRDLQILIEKNKNEKFKLLANFIQFIFKCSLSSLSL